MAQANKKKREYKANTWVYKWAFKGDSIKYCMSAVHISYEKAHICMQSICINFEKAELFQ